MASKAPGQPSDPDELAEAVLSASRMLIHLSLRALEGCHSDVNLTAFRVLAHLDQQGPNRLIDIAAMLDVTSTTATRLADHLVALGMVNRVRQSSDRREVHLEIATPGRDLVKAVSASRRDLVMNVLEGSTATERAMASRVLRRFITAEDRSERNSA